jgi:hypothetical protein
VSSAGAALVAIGFYMASRPSIYVASSFWTSSPTWFAIRVGILMVGLGAMYGASRAVSNTTARNNQGCEDTTSQPRNPLETLGRNSLFVYWIHVELVYGYASWLWRGALPLWGTAVAFAAFSWLMYGAVLWRDRLLQDTATWRRITCTSVAATVASDFSRTVRRARHEEAP